MDPRFCRDTFERGGKTEKAPNRKYLCVLSCLFGNMNSAAGRSQLESEVQLPCTQACGTCGHLSFPAQVHFQHLPGAGPGNLFHRHKEEQMQN